MTQLVSHKHVTQARNYGSRMQEPAVAEMIPCRNVSKPTQQCQNHSPAVNGQGGAWHSMHSHLPSKLATDTELTVYGMHASTMVICITIESLDQDTVQAEQCQCGPGPPWSGTGSGMQMHGSEVGM